MVFDDQPPQRGGLMVDIPEALQLTAGGLEAVLYLSWPGHCSCIANYDVVLFSWPLNMEESNTHAAVDDGVLNLCTCCSINNAISAYYSLFSMAAIGGANSYMMTSFR